VNHLPTCRIYEETINGETIAYSDPDPACTDPSHDYNPYEVTQ
jgi:hypothetical protein